MCIFPVWLEVDLATDSFSSPNFQCIFARFPTGGFSIPDASVRL